MPWCGEAEGDRAAYVRAAAEVGDLEADHDAAGGVADQVDRRAPRSRRAPRRRRRRGARPGRAGPGSRSRSASRCERPGPAPRRASASTCERGGRAAVPRARAAPGPARSWATGSTGGSRLYDDRHGDRDRRDQRQHRHAEHQPAPGGGERVEHATSVRRDSSRLRKAPIPCDGPRRCLLSRHAREAVAATAVRGGLHLPAAQRRRSTARVGLWLGICFGICFADRAGQPLRAERPTSRSRSRPARPGATGSPRGCTSSPAPRPCRCCWSSSGPSTRSCSRRPPRRTRELRPRRPRAGLDRASWSPPRSSSSRPGWPTPRSGTRGTSRSGPPTTPSPGSRSVRWSCTSRSSCRSSAARSTADVERPTYDRPDRDRARRAVAPRPAAHHVARRRRRRARDRRQHRPVAAQGLGLRRPLRRRAAGRPDQQVGGGRRRHRRPRSSRRTASTVVYGDREVVADPRRPAGDAADDRRPADRLRRGLERRAATWTGVRVRDLLDLVDAPAGTRRRRSTSLQESGPVPAHRPAGQLRRRRPHPARPRRSTASRSSLDHGYPARLIAPNRPGVLQTKWVTRLEVSA